jgi:hypothetical protein
MVRDYKKNHARQEHNSHQNVCVHLGHQKREKGGFNYQQVVNQQP